MILKCRCGIRGFAGNAGPGNMPMCAKCGETTTDANDTAPLNKLFAVTHLGGDGKWFNLFQAVFEVSPSHAEIAEAQSQAGFAQQGYGPPYAIQENYQAKEGVVVMWKCSASCD